MLGTGIRADFPILAREEHGRRLVYLDNAATTQKPQAVLDAILGYYGTSNANVHRGAYGLAVAATEAYESARSTVARFVNAWAPEGVVFTSGQRLDLIVRRPRGDEVWRWSHDKAFTQAIQTVLLRAQESVVLRVAWDQRDLQGRRVDPGTYEAIAVFMGRAESAGRPPEKSTVVTAASWRV